MAQNLNKNTANSDLEKVEHVKRAARSFAKLALEFDIPFNEFVSIYEKELLVEARRQNPTGKISEIELSTGINRKKIPKIEKLPPVKHISTIEIQVMEKLTEYFESAQTDTISLKNDISSLKNIVDKLYKGQQSYIAIGNDLVKKGCISITGNEVKFISKKIVYETNPNKFLLVLAREMNSLVDCIIDNFKAGDSGVKKFQSSWYSDQIPPEYFPEVAEEIKTKLKAFHHVIDEILVRYEEKQENNFKYPPGSFPRIGIQVNFISPRI